MPHGAFCFHHPIDAAGTVSPDVPGSEYVTGLSWDWSGLVGPGEWMAASKSGTKDEVSSSKLHIYIDLSGYRYTDISMNYRSVRIYIYNIYIYIHSYKYIFILCINKRYIGKYICGRP